MVEPIGGVVTGDGTMAFKYLNFGVNSVSTSVPIDVFNYSDNISSLILADYHYYYVDNKYLYQYNINGKILELIRYIPTIFPPDVYPSLYIDKYGRIYAYSNLSNEYNYLLYDLNGFYSKIQDIITDIPSAQIYFNQDSLLNIDNNYIVDIDLNTRLVFYSLQDTSINIPESYIYQEQDMLSQIILGYIIGFEQDILSNIRFAYYVQQDSVTNSIVHPVLYWEQIELDRYKVFNNYEKSYIRESDNNLYTLNNISFNDDNDSFLSLLRFDLLNNKLYICYLGKDFFNYTNLLLDTDIYTNFSFGVTIYNSIQYFIVESPYNPSLFFIFIVDNDKLSYLKTIQTSNQSSGVFYIHDSKIYFDDGYYVDFMTNAKNAYINNYNNVIYSDQTYFIDDYNSQINASKEVFTERYITVIPGGEGGNEFSLHIDVNGHLMGFGNNGYGQLGLGTSYFIDVWTDTGLTNIKAVYTNAYNTFVLKNDGTMWGTGYNGAGILGLGDTINRFTFVQLPTDFENPKKFVTNGFHAFIEKQDGTVWAVGANYEGRLGLGDTTNRLTLTQLPSEFNNPLAISCGQFHSILIKQDGTVWATGDNYYGQLGLGDTVNRQTFTQTSLTVSNFKSIDCGDNFTIIIDGDDVYSAGINTDGQLGVGDTINRQSFVKSTTLSGIIDVKCGSKFTTLVMDNNELYVAGSNYKYMTGYLQSTNDILSFMNVVLPFQCKYIEPNSYLTIYVDNDDNVYYTGESYSGFGYNNGGVSGANYQPLTDISIAPLYTGGIFISSLGSYTYNAVYSFLEFNNNIYMYFDKQYLYKLDKMNDTFIQILDLFTTYDNSLNPILYAQQSGFIYSFLNYSVLNNYLLANENGDIGIYNLQDTVNNVPEAQRYFNQDSVAIVNNDVVSDFDTLINLKNYYLQDTSISIPESSIYSLHDVKTIIDVTKNFPQDMVINISNQKNMQQDTFLFSIGHYIQLQDTFSKININTIYNIHNSFVFEDNTTVLNNLIVSLIYILSNNFTDKHETSYVLLYKLLLNNPINLLFYLKNSFVISRSYVLNNNILDYYDKAINLLNEINIAYQKDYKINNNILDKLARVFYILNEIKDKYELPVVLKNKLNDKLVNYLLINNNLEKYLNKEITIENIFEEDISGEIGISNYNIYISE